MTTANVRQMPPHEIVSEIRSYVDFAESTDLEMIEAAVYELKSTYRDALNEPCYFMHAEEIREAHDYARGKLMRRYNELAVAAKEK